MSSVTDAKRFQTPDCANVEGVTVPTIAKLNAKRRRCASIELSVEGTPVNEDAEKIKKEFTETTTIAITNGQEKPNGNDK